MRNKKVHGKKQRSRVSVRGKALLFIAALTLFLSLVAAKRELGPEPFAAIPSEDREVLFLGESEEGLFVVLSDPNGAVVYSIYPLSSQVIRQELFGIPDALFVSDNQLHVFLNGGEYQTLQSFDASLNLGASSVQEFYALIEPSALWAVSSVRELFVVNEEGYLCTYHTDEEEPIDTGFQNVEFLRVSSGGWIYVYSEGVLCRWQSGREEDMEWYLSDCPRYLVSDDVFVDEKNTVCRIADGELVAFMHDVAREPALVSCDEENLYVSDERGTVKRYAWNGEQTGICTVEGQIAGVAGEYILVKQEEEFQLIAGTYINQTEKPTPDVEDPTPPPTAEPTDEPSVLPSEEPTEKPTPTEEPTPTVEPSVGPTAEPSQEPTPSPEPSEEPNPTPSKDLLANCRKLYVEENYIMIPLGTSLAEIRELCGPAPVSITRADGVVLSGGQIGSGMKVVNEITHEEWTVVVFGDCDGSGTVDENDLSTAQKYFLVPGNFKGYDKWFFRSLDIDQSGTVTLSDLVLIGLLMSENY